MTQDPALPGGFGPGPAMLPWPGLAPFSRRLASARGGETFFFDSNAEGGAISGSGSEHRTFVLIHGLGDEADSWRHLLPLLAKEARVLAPDLPGFGRSVPRGRVTLARCAEALLELLEAEVIGRAVLVGSSLGAVVAQLAAARQGSRRASGHTKGRIAALALVDGGLPGLEAAPGAWRSILPILGERGYAYLSTRPELAYSTLAPYYAELESLSDEDRGFLRERVAARVRSGTQKRAYFSLFRSLALWAGLRSAFFARSLAAFPGPVLVAWGSKDRIALPGSADALIRIAPRAAKVLIEGSGHLPQQERPQALAEALLAWSALPREHGSA
jgi:pimeloyl-ACP methyl ester carboxylesterase